MELTNGGIGCLSPLKRLYNALQRAADGFFLTAFFPAITAIVTLMLYYRGMDMALIYYLGTCFMLIFLFCSDVTPALCPFLFVDIIISEQNTPSKVIGYLGGTPSDYYTRPENLTQIVVIAASIVATMIARPIITSVKIKKFPSNIFFSMCAVLVAFSLNGIFAAEYTAMDFPFGLLIGLCFVVIFSVMAAGIKPSKETFERAAYYFLALFLTITFELIMAYINHDGIIANGKINRAKIFFGWGTHNTIGMLLCTCMPALFYLAITKKHGWIFSALAFTDELCIVFSMSRQSILFGTFMYVVCIVWLLIKRGGLYRCINLLILWAYLCVFFAFITFKRDLFINSLDSLLANISYASGRFNMWKQALAYFKKYPAFGSGFFAPFTGDAGFVGIGLIPELYHGTVFQILSSAGTLGVVVYAYHRFLTVRSYLRNITTERTFITLSAAALLLVSFVDNHMFYFFPTIIYSAIIGFLSASENMKTQRCFFGNK